MVHTEIKLIPLESAFKTKNLDFIVLPGYIVADNKSEFCLTTNLEDGPAIVVSGIESIQGYREFRLGAIVYLELEDSSVKLKSIKKLELSNEIELGYKYNPSNGLKALTANTTKLYKGQSILLHGGYKAGKTTTATSIADGFEKNDIHTYRVSIGQRRGDNLGNNTIIIDSDSPATFQLKKLCTVLDKVFRDAHAGKDCCLVIDSIDKFITMQSESEPKLSRVLRFVNRLLRLSGNYINGSVTIICATGNYDTETSKRIGVELESFSDAYILLASYHSDGELNYSRV
jgi:hypothetical protein